MIPPIGRPSLRDLVAVNLLGGALQRAVFANGVSSDGMMAHLDTEGRWAPADATYALAFVVCAALYSASEARIARYRRLRAELSLPRHALLHGLEVLIFALTIVMTKSVHPCS